MNIVERYNSLKATLKGEMGGSEADLLDELLNVHKEVVKVQVQSDEALGQSNYFHGLLIGLGASIAKQLGNTDNKFTDREFLQNVYRLIKDETKGD